MNDGYLYLKDLIPYKSSADLSNDCWIIYERMDWQDKKTIGYQFITAIDSIGANIAEGYGRYHYLDRIKFYYNSRGSLLESKHWVQLLKNRNKISGEEYIVLMTKLNKLHKELNTYIKTCYSQKSISNI